MHCTYPKLAHVMAWFGNGICPFRLAGDFSLVVAAPWLLYKLRKDGAKGISIETQILRLIVFVSRYLDLLALNRTVSIYNTCMKITLVVTSLHVVTSLILQHKVGISRGGICRICLLLAFAMFMAPLYTYAPTFVEIAWSFSQFLGIVADIPQLELLLDPTNRDWRMNTYLALVVGYRGFYIPHWVVRYISEGVFDPISVVSGVFAIAVYLLAFLGILWGRYNSTRSKVPSPEEGAVKVSPEVPALTLSGKEVTDLVKT